MLLNGQPQGGKGTGVKIIDSSHYRRENENVFRKSECLPRRDMAKRLPGDGERFLPFFSD